MTPLLETRNLKAGYLSREVVRAVNLTVQRGEVVCLLGPNGAGKTTTLMTIAGELMPVDGLVLFDNVPTFTPMYQRVRDGICLVTEDRLVFTKLSTRDNLRIGGGSVEDALALFPELEPRLSVRGGMLSGGEQQMLALARALSRKPSLLLADELLALFGIEERKRQRIAFFATLAWAIHPVHTAAIDRQSADESRLRSSASRRSRTAASPASRVGPGSGNAARSFTDVPLASSPKSRRRWTATR